MDERIKVFLTDLADLMEKHEVCFEVNDEFISQPEVKIGAASYELPYAFDADELWYEVENGGR